MYPDSEAPAVSTRQCHPDLLLPAGRVKSSSSPHDTSQFPVSDYLSGVLRNAKKNDGFFRLEALIPQARHPQGKGSEAHKGGT